MRLTSRQVGCHNASKNTHATPPYHATGHPLIESYEPGEDWAWCYVDEVMMDARSLT